MTPSTSRTSVDSEARAAPVRDSGSNWRPCVSHVSPYLSSSLLTLPTGLERAQRPTPARNPSPEPVTSATAAGRTIEPSSGGRESDDSLGLITRWASALNPARSTSTYPRILPQTTRGHGCSCARAARANAGLDGSASTEVRLLQRTLAPSPSRSPTSPTHLTSTTPRPSAGLERSCELFSSSLAPRVHPPSSLSASAASHPSTHASWSPSLPPSRTRSASRSRLARTTTSTAPSRASRQTTEVRAFTLRVMERRS